MRILVVLLLFASVPLSGCGCGARQQPQRDGELLRDQTFERDGEARSYHFYEPADVSEPRPLVLTLHGGGGQIDNHIGLGRNDWPHRLWLDIADEEGLYVLVPQGVDDRWNDCRAECERCSDADDVGFLLGLIDELAGAHNIDLARVYVSGESNGGFMTQRLVQEAPERFAAAGVVISLLPANNECDVQETPTPVMYQVGTDDSLVLYGGGADDPQIDVLSAADTSAYWRRVNACDDAPTTRTYDDIDPDDSSTAVREDWDCSATGTALSLITLYGAGHVAPSIEVKVSRFWEMLAGEQNHDIEGARELWGFFEGRVRPQ